MNTQEFIFLHRNDDVRTLALKAPRDAGIDIGYALDQISGWQKARTKLPMWAENDGIVYPPHISMEQCSSERTALYKAELCRRLIEEAQADDNITPTDGLAVLTDLTGGFGVDFSYMSAAFDRAVYVERQSRLCDIARHNLGVLGITQAEVINADSEEHLRGMAPSTIIFADPARRDEHGARTFAVGDCTPDVLGMKELLLDKSLFTVLKLSPMLDLKKTLSDFGSCVGEAHIVSAGNECKELLLVISRRYEGLQRIFCVNDNSVFSFSPTENAAAETAGERFFDDERLTHLSSSDTEKAENNAEDSGRLYLYEPNTSIMKAGCHALTGRRFGARKISRDSHLLVSERLITNFPGRRFMITAVVSMNKKELKRALAGMKRANITVRNFPLGVAELRKRLKLGDGGDYYIFATTTQTEQHMLMICRKA